MATDPRFYRSLGPVSGADLAKVLNAQIVGAPDCALFSVSAPERAVCGDLCFLTGGGANSAFDAGVAVLVADLETGTAAIEAGAAAAIVRAAPKAAYAAACAQLVTPITHEGEAARHPSARIASDASLAPGVVIGQNAVIGEGAQIGANSVIGPGVVIGARTRIGSGCVIHFADVGAGCEIAAGAVIGEAGFGLAYHDGEIVSLPHVGRVVLEDTVTLGANVTVDRGMFDDTRLKTGCRIDNLCHIGHNVVVGEQAVMAAFAGVSGSVSIGSGAQFGGRVGVADHLTIGAGARLAADAAVMRDVPDGETWAGSPAQPIQRFMRETAWVRREAGRRARARKDKS